MSDALDQLRARGWSAASTMGKKANADAVKAPAYVQVHHADRATAEAMLLAACAVADGLPTERERALAASNDRLWEALNGLIPFARGNSYVLDLIHTALDEARAALTPTKEAPDGV